jgi:hypothetical protein
MTLSALIRGTRKVAKVATVAVANPEEEVATRGARNFATAIPAIPAIPATQPEGEETTVAKVATVAVANPKKEKTAPLPEVGAGAATSRWWRLRFADREPLEIACTPPATREEVLAGRPGATEAEPFTPTVRQPSAPLTPDEEKTIRRWLSAIGERDEATIAEVIDRCRRDAAARGCFLEMAKELPAAGEAGLC